jgi:hypothetical protein
VSRQISRHDPKLEHITNYVPNYETIFFHLLWGDKNQMMKAMVTVGTMRSLVRSSQSAYYLFSQMTKNSFLCCYHSHRRPVTKPKLTNASYPQGETEKNRDKKTDAYESSLCCSVAVVSGALLLSGSSSH